MPTVVITFGTFDILHPGHINILQRARKLGDSLVVGVSTDELNSKKGKNDAFYNETIRENMVEALECTDIVFKEESLEKKAAYVHKFNADILVMGEDWQGKFDWVGEHTGCKVVYLPRTDGISTTAIKKGTVSACFAPPRR